MSRSNHYYFNLCYRMGRTNGAVIGEDGYCDWHRPIEFGGKWRFPGPNRTCYSERSWVSRRGIVHRKHRYPFYRFHRSPPRWFKQQCRKDFRRKCQQDFQRHGEFTNNWKKWANGKLNLWW